MSQFISDAVCAWCAAPRVSGPRCPRCGADYAKAAQIRRTGKAAVEARAPEGSKPSEPGVDAGIDSASGRAARLAELSWPAPPVVSDPRLEFRFCVAAIPVALACGALFHALLPGLQRVFLGMPVHELGHALTAWFCGHWAVPTLWKTVWGQERGVVAPLVVGGLLAWMMVSAWRSARFPLLALGAVLLLVQAVCTFALRPDRVSALITWGGDGTGMLIATALMASFFFGRDTQLYRGSLRWGFLVIGAGAFADIFGSWWHARTDPDSVPFGENEGSGLSDPLVLLEQHHWMSGQIIQRYVLTGLCCLLALAIVYAWGVWQARQGAEAGVR